MSEQSSLDRADRIILALQHMSPEEATSMCCRLRIDNRKLYRKGGGLFGASPLTGSIGVVTLNMPRIGNQESTERGYFQRLQGFRPGRCLDSLLDNMKPFPEETLRRFMEGIRHRFGVVSLRYTTGIR